MSLTLQDNEHGSEAFEHFLHLLGDRIDLEGFGGYRGDLDVKTNTMGTQSVYTVWRDFEISTWFPSQMGTKRNEPILIKIGSFRVVPIWLGTPIDF